MLVFEAHQTQAA